MIAIMILFKFSILCIKEENSRAFKGGLIQLYNDIRAQDFAWFHYLLKI